MSPNALVRFLVASLILGSVVNHACAQNINGTNGTTDNQSASNDAAFLTNAPTDPNSLIPPPLTKTADAPSATETPKDTLKGTSKGALKAPSNETVSTTEIKDMSLKGLDADSPFFTERQEAKTAMAEAGREGFGMYVPKPPHPPIQQQMKTFFSGIFGSGKAGKHEATPMILTLSPSDVSLSQTSELDVTFKLSNAKNQELEILYPDNQRLEILIKDSSGKIVNRWSQDRAFEHAQGFVSVNPQEFITYTEKIATTGMKAGETYTIEVSLANQQGFVASTKVTPQP